MHIGIIGKMVSGKTTTSQHLINEYDYTQISLADPIKWVVNNINRGTPSDLYYRYLHPHINPALSGEDQVKFIHAIGHITKIPNEEAKPRKRLQWFGTEGARERISDDIWIKIMLERIRVAPGVKFVCDDIRFPNELSALQAAEFKLIKLEVDEATQAKRIKSLYGEFDESILLHPSEAQIAKLKGDAHVDASESLELMLMNVDKILRGWV